MIVAIDFDGILCENVFPEIGAPHYEVISVVRQLLDLGVEVILWTSRADEELTKAVAWCADYGLKFTAINANAPSNLQQYSSKYPNGTRKVYADYYIDDHNIEYRVKTREGYKAPLHHVVACIEDLIYDLKKQNYDLKKQKRRGNVWKQEEN